MDLAQTLLELGGILLGLGILGRLANLIGLSPIPFYLLGGLLFGVGGVIPLSGSEDEFIEIGAQMGVILLLFLLGLEYSASELVKNLKTHYVSGILDFVLNATPGAAIPVAFPSWSSPSVMMIIALPISGSLEKELIPSPIA